MISKSGIPEEAESYKYEDDEVNPYQFWYKTDDNGHIIEIFYGGEHEGPFICCIPSEIKELKYLKRAYIANFQDCYREKYSSN